MCLRSPLTLAVLLALSNHTTHSWAQTRLPVMPEVRVEAKRATPLNNDTRADSASLLGLTPRETPATVEVINRATIELLGLRSVTEAVQGAVGVTAGDGPAEPAGFSMRLYQQSDQHALQIGRAHV